MDAKKRRGVGKSDALDAHQIAMSTLPLPVDKLRRPRLNKGLRQGLRILVTARESMTKDRTRSVNALNALAQQRPGHRCPQDAHRRPDRRGFKWRSREEELSLSIARAEAERLAKHVLELDEQLTTNENQLDELLKAAAAAPLLELKGFGPVTAAKCLTAWSHEGGVRNEAGFASWAGVNPIPASSGNTVRHRLNRGGDRSLNSALHTVARCRMTHDPEARAYVEKRRVEDSNREIRRCVKRYLARRVFRVLNAAAAAMNAA